MEEETTNVSWRAVRTTLRFLWRLKDEITTKWDKIFSAGLGLISPDHTPISTPAPSFPLPVPPFQLYGAPPFPLPAPRRSACLYTGHNGYGAYGSNHIPEHFNSIQPWEYAGRQSRHELLPDFYNSQFHPSFEDNAAPQGEPLIDDQLGQLLGDLLDNEIYLSNYELVVTEQETTTLEPEMSTVTVESIKHEAVMDTGEQSAPGIDQSLGEYVIDDELGPWLHDLYDNEIHVSSELVVTKSETTTIEPEMSTVTVESIKHEAVIDKGAPSAPGIDQSLGPAFRSKSRRTKAKRELKVAVAPSKHKCKGITGRSGKFVAEIRVSMTKLKVWLGTYATMEAAKRAYDAGLRHCTQKEGPYHYKHLIHRLSPSIYKQVLELYLGDDPKGLSEIKKKVKGAAQAHALLDCDH